MEQWTNQVDPHVYARFMRKLLMALSVDGKLRYPLAHYVSPIEVRKPTRPSALLSAPHLTATAHMCTATRTFFGIALADYFTQACSPPPRQPACLPACLPAPLGWLEYSCVPVPSYHPPPTIVITIVIITPALIPT